MIKATVDLETTLKARLVLEILPEIFVDKKLASSQSTHRHILLEGTAEDLIEYIKFAFKLAETGKVESA